MAENTTPKSTFKTTSVIALVLLVAAVVGIFLLFLPAKASHEINSTQLTQKQTELSSLKTQLSKLQGVESSFEGSEVTQKDVLNSIPENLEQDQIIKALSEIADDNQVSLNSLSFSIGSEPDIDVQVLTIATNISGKHIDLINFLKDLETDGRKFVVNNISVQTLENRLENMSISMNAYFL